MPGQVFRCELCKTAGKDFTTPVDTVGAAIMEQHLVEEHKLDPNYRGNDDCNQTD